MKPILVTVGRPPFPLAVTSSRAVLWATALAERSDCRREARTQFSTLSFCRKEKKERTSDVLVADQWERRVKGRTV